MAGSPGPLPGSVSENRDYMHQAIHTESVESNLASAPSQAQMDGTSFRFCNSAERPAMGRLAVLSTLLEPDHFSGASELLYGDKPVLNFPRPNRSRVVFPRGRSRGPTLLESFPQVEAYCPMADPSVMNRYGDTLGVWHGSQQRPNKPPKKVLPARIAVSAEDGFERRLDRLGVSPRVMHSKDPFLRAPVQGRRARLKMAELLPEFGTGERQVTGAPAAAPTEACDSWTDDLQTTLPAEDEKTPLESMSRLDQLLDVRTWRLRGSPQTIPTASPLPAERPEPPQLALHTVEIIPIPDYLRVKPVRPPSVESVDSDLERARKADEEEVNGQLRSLAHLVISTQHESSMLRQAGGMRVRIKVAPSSNYEAVATTLLQKVDPRSPHSPGSSRRVSGIAPRPRPRFERQSSAISTKSPRRSSAGSAQAALAASQAQAAEAQASWEAMGRRGPAPEEFIKDFAKRQHAAAAATRIQARVRGISGRVAGARARELAKQSEDAAKQKEDEDDLHLLDGRHRRPDRHVIYVKPCM